jgi:decaprenylphospho-beta-D-erythro-pentofuranosid-2-ulose 2-reductase
MKHSARINTMQRIVIFGATSTIAIEIAKIFSERKAALFLVARNESLLTQVTEDLRVRGATVSSAIGDMRNEDSLQSLFDSASTKMGGIDAVVIAHGTLPDQRKAEEDIAALYEEIEVNFVSAAALAQLAANYFAPQRKGNIAVISSVAGDRGRQSNYVYGSAKAGLTAFLSGLRNRLSPMGVQVLTVLPGFVDTKMTAGLRKNKLYASPDSVARSIVRAMEKGTSILYTPWFWRYIMLIIKNIPECVFKKLKL